MFQGAIRFQAFPELLCLAIVSLGVIFTSSIDVHGDILYKINLITIFIHILLSAYLYFILRIAFSNYVSVFIIMFLCWILYYASFQKFIHIKEPLIANDIFSTSLIGMAARYANYSALLFIALFVLSVYFIIILRWKSFGIKISSIRISSFVLALFASVYLFNTFKDKALRLLHEFGVTYYNWNIPANFNENGIFIHLFQTSVRNIPQKPSSDEWGHFRPLISLPGENATKRMVVILCEACWYEKDRFYNEFRPLVDIGATEMRGISPIYGGGTPNATIELVSGLPVRNPAVSGVLYHEYRDLFASRTWTLPYQLQTSGYITASMHNYYKDFWYRAKVEPKLGLGEFYGIEDMPAKSTEYEWPRDKVVYDYARDFLDVKAGKRVFLHLATVHMHGPYDDNGGDNGESAYLAKARRTVADTVEFVTHLIEREPETVIFIYSDHKPALHGVFDGYTNVMLGDVPILIYDRNQERAAAFRNRASGKPFYCYTRYLSELYFQFRLPSAAFTDVVCEPESQEDYAARARSVPGWVYHATFFDIDNEVGELF